MSDSIAFQARFGNDFLIPSTLEECYKECRDTRRLIRTLEREASTHRANEQAIQLQQFEAQGDSSGAKRRRRLRKAENTKRMYAKLRSVRGSTKSGITHIEVPADPTVTDYKSCKEWISINTPT
jgi:hypothetical protein